MVTEIWVVTIKMINYFFYGINLRIVLERKSNGGFIHLEEKEPYLINPNRIMYLEIKLKKKKNNNIKLLYVPQFLSTFSVVHSSGKH